MTKKKLILIIIAVIIAAAAVALALMVFVFDTFGLYTADYKLDYDKYVKVGEYKGLTYEKEEVKVSDKEVKAEIDNRLAQAATTENVTEGKVKDGDTIIISYEGKIDGKTFEGGSAENSTITIGQTPMIDGFTDGLIGKKVGETVKLDLKFPEPYENNPDLSGKPVVFEITINSKQVTKTPEYNEEFITANSDVKTKKDYEKQVKEDLLKSKKEQEESRIKSDLWNQVIEASEVKKYPKEQVAYEKEQFVENYKQLAESYNMEWKDFLQQYANTTEEDFKKQSDTYAKDMVKNNLVMRSIAKKEDIKIVNKEYKKYLDELLQGAGFTEESFKNQYNESIEKYAEKKGIKSNYLLQKVMDKIMEYGKEKSK